MPALQFEQPAWFWLLPLLIVPLVAAARRPRFAWPGVVALDKVVPDRTRVARFVPVLVRIGLLAALIVALARPQSPAGAARVNSRGVAIVVALDISKTMSTTPIDAAQNAPTRLDAARALLLDFIAGRPDDLIGLVSFADYPDTTCPPTLDHAFLGEAIQSVPPAPPSEPGTNLGDALAWAVRDAREASPPRKAIVLITDGQNEPGAPAPLNPLEAARLVRDFDIKLHLIHLTPRNESPPALLAAMAQTARGTLHAAADRQALSQVLRAVNDLTPSTFQGNIPTRYHSWFTTCLWAALALLAVEQCLALSRWRGIP